MHSVMTGVPFLFRYIDKVVRMRKTFICVCILANLFLIMISLTCAICNMELQQHLSNYVNFTDKSAIWTKSKPEK